jgi:hypothetical protein
MLEMNFFEAPMFDYEADVRRFSMPLFWMQILGVPFGLMICGLSVSLVVATYIPGLKMLGSAVHGDIIIGYPCYAATGFIIGYLVGKSAAQAYFSGGRWVWIAPMCLLLWALVDEPEALSRSIEEAFLGQDTAGAVVMTMVTLPVVASCFYSIGLVVGAPDRSTAL